MTFEPWVVGDPSPSVKSHSEATLALNADIEILTVAKDTLEIIPVKALFESVIIILGLVRDEMVDDDEFVELAKYCVRACHVLKIATEGRVMDNLNGPTQEAIEGLEKTIRSIETNLKACKHASGVNHLWERHSGSAGACPVLWKMEIQKTLRIFDATSRGYSFPAPAGPPPSPDSGERALQRLIGGAVPPGELFSLIESIFSSERATDMVGHLRGCDTQTFVDTADEALGSLDLAPETRKKCMRSLYEMCAGHVLLPRPLQIELSDVSTGVPLFRGGFGDVWKHEYRGQEVAVKVLRRYADSDLQKFTRRFCKEFVAWRGLRHPNVLPLLGVIMSETQFAMVSGWMPNGNINQFVKAHQNINRFELLGDVAKGLIYVHDQRMVHGDPKGANILIDGTSHARLADFGLLATISDTTSLGSSIHGGTFRWMSPELFYPEDFGLKDSRRTKQSDCYALGMVIWEVLSGQVPFPQYDACAVVVKVSRGERPERPQGAGGAWFTDGVWGVLESCWIPKRDDRPGIKDVLLCLEEGSRFWTANLPTTNSPVQNPSDSNTEGGMESEVTSLSYVAPQKGDADDETRIPTLQDLEFLISQICATQWNESSGRDSASVGLMWPSIVCPVVSPPIPIWDLPSIQDPIPYSPPIPTLATGWVKVPQRPYTRGRRQWDFKPSEPIAFTVNGLPGINMGDALRKKFTGLDGWDDPMFGSEVRVVTCRFLFPGYRDGSVQILTSTWGKNRVSITRSKFVYEVAKRLDRYLKSTAGHIMDRSTDQQWKIGEGFMDFEHMHLVRLVPVSAGSVQPEIWIPAP